MTDYAAIWRPGDCCPHCGSRRIHMTLLNNREPMRKVTCGTCGRYIKFLAKHLYQPQDYASVKVRQEQKRLF